MDEKNDITPTAQTELKDFVRRTVEEVLDGIEEARENIDNDQDPNFSHTETEVQFDLAVTTSESGDTSGKFEINVAKVVEVGIEGGETEESTATNRVQFSVPLQIKPIASGGEKKSMGGGFAARR